MVDVDTQPLCLIIAVAVLDLAEVAVCLDTHRVEPPAFATPLNQQIVVVGLGLKVSQLNIVHVMQSEIHQVDSVGILLIHKLEHAHQEAHVLHLNLVAHNNVEIVVLCKQPVMSQ